MRYDITNAPLTHPRLSLIQHQQPVSIPPMGALTYKWLYLLAGIALRVGLLFYGRYQDANFDVPYTDIDYSVFSDATKYLVDGCPLSHTVYAPGFESGDDVPSDGSLHCAQGFLPIAARFVLANDPIHVPAEDVAPLQHDSAMFTASNWSFGLTRPVFKLVASLGDPYARSTYRYTPFLAALLSPVHLFGWPEFGKVLFAAADVLCAVLMWALLDGRRAAGTRQGAYVHLPGLLWLLNPIPAQIATRGSSEALVGFLVLLFVYFLLSSNPEAPIGAVPTHADPAREPTTATDKTPTEAAIPTYRPLLPELALPLSEWSINAFLSPIVLGLAAHLKLFPVIYGIPVMSHLAASTRLAYPPALRQKLGFLSTHAAGITYGIMTFSSFMLINALAWIIWGTPFLEHSFLYHLTRKDHRHNFSPYFLVVYLTDAAESLDTWQERVLASPLLSFGPQLLLVIALGWSLGSRDVVAAMTAQTIAFVAFNKVSTSQYFLWFLWLLPVVLPSLSVSKLGLSLVIAAWIGAQVSSNFDVLMTGGWLYR